MKKIILPFLIFISAISSFSQTAKTNAGYDFGFEKLSPFASLDNNWNQIGSGYNLIFDSSEKHSGKYSLLIEATNNRDSNSYGYISYRLPPKYIGKEMEIRGSMKLKNVEKGDLGLFIQFIGDSGVISYDDMKDKNLSGTIDWKTYSAKLPYPKNAKLIYFGAMFSGSGKVWIDDIELLLDGENITKQLVKECKAYKDNEFDKGSKINEIHNSKETIDNLTILGEVWGFLKYYHPSIAKGDYNWDYELFRITPKILSSKNAVDRDNILSNWIRTLGNVEPQVNLTDRNNEIKLKPDLSWITKSNLSQELSTQILAIKNAKRTEEHFYVGLTEVKSADFLNENKYAEMKYPDAGFRLLSLYRYWNIIQYYYPYKYLIEEDWKNVLKEFIPKFIDASNEIEYKLAVLELIARVHDTHANIWGQDATLKKYWGVNYAPAEVSFIENKAVVTYFYDEDLGKKSGLQIGDVITKINNKPVDKIVLEKLKYTPASNYTTQLRNIAGKLLRTNDTLMNIEFTRNSKSESRQINTYSTSKINIYKKYQNQDTCFKFIKSEIAYLYLGSIKNEYLPDIMSRVQNAKGLIIDLRCYPSDFTVFSLNKYFLPDSTEFVKFTKASLIQPGTFTYKYTLKAGSKNIDYYKGKIVLLVNETTQSQAEYTAMAFRVAPRATVVGSTTAGADGNVSEFYLPGGIMTMISGIGVYYPDGRETQRIGIIPDVEVKPTTKGVVEKRDELLDKAIEIIDKP